VQKATLGRIVHVLVDPTKNNASDVAPAIVTHVFGEPYVRTDGLGQSQTVNVRVLCDSHNTLWCTSIQLFEQRPTAEQLEALNQYNPKGYETVAFWPPKAG
jgi:hypothetical protein